MCGIFGIVSGSQTSDIDQGKVRRATELMIHRGPDARGDWGIPGKVSLAHMRLSIVDLSPSSNQPFLSSCGRYATVFNGEIYNYLELKEELRSEGYSFRTASDTEVLLTAYIAWGQRCVSKFNGDWAFAIYDTHTDLLFCSRDRFGVKPLNIAIVNGTFAFASEAKSLIAYFPELRAPHLDAIASYCRTGLGAQHHQTWFSGITRLPPGHNLTWHNGRVATERYWFYPTTTNNSVTSADAVANYRNLFTEAVRVRMRSDVPVGTTLSSGLDSSSIVSVIRTFDDGPHHTFTATFPEKEFDTRDKVAYRQTVQMDERDGVENMAERLGLEPHFVDTSSLNFINDLSRTIYHLESGHSSPATVPLSKVFDAARDYVTVVMEGQGADELLGGYTVNMFPSLILQLATRGRFWQAKREAEALAMHYSLKYAAILAIRKLNYGWIDAIYYRAVGVERAFGPKLRNREPLSFPVIKEKDCDEQFNQTLRESHSQGLVNLLHYGDALSMASSVESRLPFVDVNLVEYAFKLPYSLKIRDGFGKYIHRLAMSGIVPESILNTRVKIGFNTPIGNQFNHREADGCRLLLSDRCLARGLFDPQGLRSLIDAHIGHIRDHSNVLFRFLSVELWFRRFVDPTLENATTPSR